MSCLERRVKTKRKVQKNILDEMQEHKLLSIEEIGLWLSFWGLCIAITIQCFLGTTFKGIAGEICVLAVLSLYIIVSSIKNGLWTKNSTPSIKINLLVSFIPSIIFGAVLAARSLFILHREVPIAFTLLSMAGVYAGCFVVLEITGRLYEKRRKELDDIDGETGE